MKKFLYVVGLSSLLILSGCSGEDKADTGEQVEQSQEADKQGADQKIDDLKIERDEEAKDEIEKEEDVSFANVIVTDTEDGDYVLIDITLDKESELDFEKLGDKYGEKLKKKYEDREVRVMVKKGVEEVYNSTY